MSTVFSQDDYRVCEETGKRCYNERQAGAILNSLKRHQYAGSHLRRSKERPRRKYFCRHCGCFHLTHLPYYDEDSRTGAWEERFFKRYESQKGRKGRAA